MSFPAQYEHAERDRLRDHARRKDEALNKALEAWKATVMLGTTTAERMQAWANVTTYSTEYVLAVDEYMAYLNKEG